MPISAIDGCTADHWAEVKAVVVEAVESIEDPRFVVRLVSDSDESGVIQKRIVQNVYNSDIIVCDVSAKNPNVMFELGLRLAFDKPTVIIKDDTTDYSFDTGIIEHVAYPRDLRFAKIVDFKNTLADKVLATYKAALADPNHSPFLKNFGSFRWPPSVKLK
jgi:nucleoside 2-deoxyribosyltransferase